MNIEDLQAVATSHRKVFGSILSAATFVEVG
jgi:hypothetical protein